MQGDGSELHLGAGELPALRLPMALPGVVGATPATVFSIVADALQLGLSGANVVDPYDSKVGVRMNPRVDYCVSRTSLFP